MKRVVAWIIALVIVLSVNVQTFAAELNDSERYVLEQLSSDESLSVEFDRAYINQLENYFLRNNVTISKANAEAFIENLKETFALKEKVKTENNEISNYTELVNAASKAWSRLNLYFVLDSEIREFRITDKDGSIVIDTEKIIKDTGSISQLTGGAGLSITYIFIGFMLVVAVLIEIRKYHKKWLIRTGRMFMEDPEEDENAIETMNRRRYNPVFTYNNVIHVLKYCYISISFILIIAAIGKCIISQKQEYVQNISNAYIGKIGIEDVEISDEYALMEANGDEEQVLAESISWPVYGNVYGQIKCEKLNIDAPVYMGDSGSVLVNGAGTYLGSSIPGDGKTILVGAHCTEYFAGLEYVEKGDKFEFVTTYGMYTYKVKDIVIAEGEDIDKTYDLASDEEQLVLYTCYPFGKWQGAKESRMFVILNPVSGPKIVR